MDSVAVEPARVEPGVDVARNHDRGVEPVAEPSDSMPRGIDIEMEFGMAPLRSGSRGIRR